MQSVVITEENFDTEVKKSRLPVLVSFWLTGEHPLDSVSERFGGKLKLGKINVNDEPNLVYKYRVRNFPTLLLFREGKVADTIVGVTRVDQLMRILS
ncbi:MAG: thioredoxin [Oscillospiraceae bacterium]|nr:thioredoxin [Oscillospiraceae bacterium]